MPRHLKVTAAQIGRTNEDVHTTTSHGSIRCTMLWPLPQIARLEP
ncbi:MAG TPA: hypothetical protein VGV13_02000 [Methylomirabilota bacterium]|jgi:hypothetical protein|nr:hypothetical protein [Methylomirabilota bacterium]